ncbi:MAG: hypothetical protein HN341_06370 [Verrucomicrobia bacterium]|nr:hypothetical protein [Verrucomicrobiota bacterium]
MNILNKNILLAVGLVALLWSVFSWPLPTVLDRGIPSSSQNIELHERRSLIPGDQLQLYYSFWLVRQMVHGDIPWFQNVYEFNEGDDDARRELRHFYLPISVPCALLSFLTGPVIAWNLTGFATLLLSYVFAFYVYRSFTEDRWTAHAGALVSIAIPYRWVNFLGGSPAGFAMLWPAAMAWAVDRTVRRHSCYGFLAGLALLFSRFTDIHVFFFTALATPVLFLICAVNVHGLGSDLRRMVTRTIWGVAMTASVGSLALLYSLIRSRAVAVSNLGGIREPAEVALLSPPVSALVHWRGSGLVSHAYVGYVMLLLFVLLFAGAVLVLFRKRERIQARLAQIVVPILFLAVLLLAIDLALGINGVGGVRKWQWLCGLIPPYGQVRQPTKVLCLFPLLGGVAIIALQRLLAALKSPRRFQRWIVLAISFAVIVECSLQVRATITLLPETEPSYARVVADAQARGDKPQAVAVPLWPGDSAWTSIEQYATTRHPIRLLNGYQPVVPHRYYDGVFAPLKSLNKGELTEAQDVMLGKMGVDYVIVRENAFPEKVSPFSVWHTIRAFTRSPFLEPLATDRGVWAFRRLGSEPRSEVTGEPPSASWVDADWYGFSRVYAADRCSLEEGTEDGTVQLVREGAFLETPSTSAGAFPSMRWVWMVRGAGVVALVSQVNSQAVSAVSVELGDAAADWSWIESSAGLSTRAQDRFSCRLELKSGAVDVKSVLLADGMLMGDYCGDIGAVPLSIPAIAFFHAGQGCPEDGSVLFQPDVDVDGAIFYGLRHPLAAGRYELLLDWEGAVVEESGHGTLECLVGVDADPVANVPVAGETPTRLEFVLPEADLMSVRFTYNRRAAIRLKGIRLARRHPKRVEAAEHLSSYTRR